MKADCPYCQGQYDIDPVHLGQKVQCPDCENKFEFVNPNLMPCPDCLAQISKRAQACPHCGAVLGRQSMSIGRTNVAVTKGDISSEKEIMVFHPSAMNYFWAIIFGIVTIPLLLIGVLILLYIWVNIRYTTYTITSQRIIVRRGWIGKMQNEIWIKDMRGVNLIQGVWQGMIDVGNISIGTAATAETEICIIGVAKPQKVVDTINSLRQ